MGVVIFNKVWSFLVNVVFCKRNFYKYFDRKWIIYVTISLTLLDGGSVSASLSLSVLAFGGLAHFREWLFSHQIRFFKD